MPRFYYHFKVKPSHPLHPGERYGPQPYLFVIYHVTEREVCFLMRLVASLLGTPDAPQRAARGRC